MARDRQRAKQRRQRRGGSVRAGARPAPAPPPSDPRDLEDVTDTGATPAPDPLKHASAEVDEARLAEAGAVHPDYDEDELVPADGRVREDVDEEDLLEDEERAPDAVEGDLVPATDAERAEAAARGERQRGRLITFLRHCVDELRRVQWPDRRQTGQDTAVTLGFVVIAGGFLGLMDAIWKPLVEAIL